MAGRKEQFPGAHSGGGHGAPEFVFTPLRWRMVEASGEEKMIKRRLSGFSLLIATSCFLFAVPSGLAGQRRAAEAMAKQQVYVVPFSHLDLFWAGTREECLSRGNRIIARAIQIAEQHPEFKFLIESDNFLANFAETH